MNIFAALDGRIPGINVSGENITIRGITSLSEGTEENGSTGPLFLLNGIPVSKNAILSVPIENVDFVDVLKGTKATIYGSSASNGVIAVYTLNASDILKNTKEEDSKSIVNFTHPGYSTSTQFVAPTQKENNQPTIYWNPSIKLTANEIS